MSAFSEMLVARSGYERDGFADVYDAHRPAPPAALLDILQLVAQVERPRLVIDLGAGTGLSTRVWAERAEEVVGVEANASMLERARAATVVANVRYVEAFAAETGLRSVKAARARVRSLSARAVAASRPHLDQGLEGGGVCGPARPRR
jgi:SAM-dependent methyltransferase